MTPIEQSYQHLVKNLVGYPSQPSFSRLADLKKLVKQIQFWPDSPEESLQPRALSIDERFVVYFPPDEYIQERKFLYLLSFNRR
jgi:hypothetical protein